MSYDNGLRINCRIEKDIIPFLVRNYLWNQDKNEPTKGMVTLEWVEKIEDVGEREYKDNFVVVKKEYWYFTKKGKENICKLINNLY